MENSIIFVQRLRSKPWTYMSKFFVSFFLSFCIQFSRLLIGYGPGFWQWFWHTAFQDIVTSNAGAWLSSATLRFSSLAEQCHTQKIYLRCFKSDFDVVKGKFSLHIK